jgi:hypothetical protein
MSPSQDVKVESETSRKKRDRFQNTGAFDERNPLRAVFA